MSRFRHTLMAPVALPSVLVAAMASSSCGGSSSVESAVPSEPVPAVAASTTVDAATASRAAGLLPADTVGFVEVRDPTQLWPLLGIFGALAGDAAVMTTKKEWIAEVQSVLSVGEAEASTIIDGISQLAIAVRLPDEDAPEPDVVLLAFYKDESKAAALLGSPRLKPAVDEGEPWGDDVTVYSPQLDGAPNLLREVREDMVIASAPREGGIAIVAGTSALVRDTLGQREKLAAEPRYRDALRIMQSDALFNLYVDPRRLGRLSTLRPARELLGQDTPMALSMGLGDRGMRFSMTAAIAGSGVNVDMLPEPTVLDLGPRLPQSTAAYMSMSLAWSDQQVDALIALLGLIEPELREREIAFEQLFKVSVKDVVTALGRQVTVGWVSSKGKLGIESDPFERGALVLVQKLDDVSVISGVMKRAERVLLSQDIKVTASDSGLTTLLPNGRMLSAQIRGDELWVVGGAKGAVELALNKDAAKLGDRADHLDLFATFPERDHVRAWVDLSQFDAMQPNDPDVLRRLFGAQGVGSATFRHTGRELSYELHTYDLLGAFAAVGIYGVRRYLASAKVSEAKNTIGAMARGAVAAFEREQASGPMHQLCKSAPAVPATVPAGTKYQPQPGVDFDQEAWRCLKFSMMQPHYFQYEYRAMTNDYKGPKRGGPDPGPNGFEVSAEGDLDGDGKTSLFTRTGRIENGRLVLSTDMFIVDEFE